jgi:hypothetical protein
MMPGVLCVPVLFWICICVSIICCMVLITSLKCSGKASELLLFKGTLSQDF